MEEGQEHDICYIVNTAEYCAENCPKLEELIQKTV
jgi:hypothetical protein